MTLGRSERGSSARRWVDPRAHQRRLASLALFQQPAPVVAYVLLVAGVALGLAVWFVPGTDLGRADWGTLAVLLGCGAASVEVARRVGEPAGLSKDLLAAWTLPIALLLPPVCALLAPAPLTAFKQLRVGRSPVYRRVFSASALGLEGFLRAAVFQHLAGPLPEALRGRPLHTAGAVLLALGCGLVVAQVNQLLVAVAVHLSMPEAAWRDLLASRENLVLDLGEICFGLLIAVGWMVSPVIAVVALPPMMLLQRSLTHAQLEAAARTDAKTGLLNANAWQQEAEREIARAHRTGSPLVVVIADLDHFKSVNDTYGHLVGDRLLTAVAAALQARLRDYDVLGRFGGEEFTLVLPHTEPAEAEQIARRLRADVAAVSVAIEGAEPVRVTVSMGAAVYGVNGADLTELLAAADLALYRSKTAGRDRVRFAPAG